MAPDTYCRTPGCNPDPADVLGIEVRGVYDGVLYWFCRKCDEYSNRWEPDPATGYDRLHQAAERHIGINKMHHDLRGRGE